MRLAVHRPNLQQSLRVDITRQGTSFTAPQQFLRLDPMGKDVTRRGGEGPALLRAVKVRLRQVHGTQPSSRDRQPSVHGTQPNVYDRQPSTCKSQPSVVNSQRRHLLTPDPTRNRRLCMRRPPGDSALCLKIPEASRMPLTLQQSREQVRAIRRAERYLQDGRHTAFRLREPLHSAPQLGQDMEQGAA